MFDIKILGLTQAKLFSWWATRTISLISGDIGEMPCYGGDHLLIECKDIEDPSGFNPPLRSHIDKILAFSKDFTKDDKVLIHCIAGMRRSTATAIGVMIQHGSTIEDAFDRCYKLRPIMVPNRLILKLFDDALGLNGELASYGGKWVKQHIAAKYLEEFKEIPQN